MKMHFVLPQINSIYSYIANEIYFIACYLDIFYCMQQSSLIPFKVFNKEQMSTTFVCISYLVFLRHLCTRIK